MKAITISADAMKNYQIIMTNGNSKLKQCAELADMTYSKFRLKFFSSGMQPDKMDVSNKVVLALNQAMPDIKAVRNIEELLFNGYFKLARKLASRTSGCSRLERDDAEQEAYMALVDAIYSYTKPEIAFGTYVWHVINRRLWAASNQQSIFGSPTNELLKLMRRYNAKKEQLSVERQVNSEEILEQLDLSKKERLEIVDYLASCNICNPVVSDSADVTYSDDYTCFRKNVSKERNKIPEQYAIQDAMHRANLTVLERQILVASLNSHRGWLTEFAKNSSNPRNDNKPYTKQRIQQVFEVALDKVRKTYKTNEEHMTKFRMAG